MPIEKMLSPKHAVSCRPVTWVVRRFFASSRNASELLSRTRVSPDVSSAQPSLPDVELINEDDEWTTRPWYPQTSDSKRCQARRGLSINPESTCVVLFPGESTSTSSPDSRADGRMRRPLLRSPRSEKGREMLLAASDILKTDLEEECAKKSGSISQPAILVHSLIAAEEMVRLQSSVNP